jgi:hypothetical protein
MVPQSNDFRRDLITLLQTKRTYTVFHTDDDLFFRSPPVAPFVPDDYAAFSLRLGENITFWYGARSEQTPPAAKADGELLDWEWPQATGYFGYPMSLNGHVMRTDLIRGLVRHARFQNPNELEEELDLRRYRTPPRMLSFRQSCVVTIPANIVSSTHVNRASENPNWSAGALNVRFLAGERIDIDAMDFSAVRGAHQEIPYVFSRRSSPPPEDQSDRMAL